MEDLKKKYRKRPFVAILHYSLFCICVECVDIFYTLIFFHRGALLLLLIGKYHVIEITHIPDSEVP